MTVNNGLRVKLELGDFTGLAGMVVAADGKTATIAYFPNKKGMAPTAGTAVAVGNVEWTVVRREPSVFVPRMVVLTLAVN